MVTNPLYLLPTNVRNVLQVHMGMGLVGLLPVNARLVLKDIIAPVTAVLASLAPQGNMEMGLVGLLPTNARLVPPVNLVIKLI